MPIVAPNRSPARIGGRFALVVVSASLPLLALELFLRLAYPGSVDTMNNAAFTRVSVQPGQMTELIPGATNAHFMGGAVRVNAHGFRGAEFAIPKPAGTFRILAVGDSVTFGFGVAEEAAFPSLLASSLQAPGQTVEVINAGLPGAGLPYYFQTVRRWCDHADADVVVVSVVLNDILAYRPEESLDQPMPAKGQADPAGFGGPIRRSYVYTAGFRALKSVLYAVHVLDLRDSPGFRFVPLEEDEAERVRAWEASLKLLDLTVAEGARCGVPLVVAVFPLELQLSPEALTQYREDLGVALAANATDLAPQATLATWAADRGVPFVDLTPAFQRDEPRALFLRGAYVTFDPVHPSPLGHERAAAELAEALREGGFLPTR